MQSCILAGGVAVGVSMSAVHQPWEAMAIGFSAAVLSMIGLQYIKVLIAAQIHIDCLNLLRNTAFHYAPIFQIHMLLAYQCHDTCDVLSTHAIPGLLGWLAHLILEIRHCDDQTV